MTIASEFCYSERFSQLSLQIKRGDILINGRIYNWVGDILLARSEFLMAVNSPQWRFFLGRLFNVTPVL